MPYIIKVAPGRRLVCKACGAVEDIYIYTQFSSFSESLLTPCADSFPSIVCHSKDTPEMFQTSSAVIIHSLPPTTTLESRRMNVSLVSIGKHKVRCCAILSAEATHNCILVQLRIPHWLSRSLNNGRCIALEMSTIGNSRAAAHTPLAL
jgi:hypothetical protein